MSSIAVVGVGNNLLQDDGAGIHTLRHFESHHSSKDVECLDAGTVGLAMMDRLTNLDGLVAVDAMRLGKPAGTITVLQGEEMDAHLRNHHGSVHELGLSDILDALRLCDDLPANRALVGIEPEQMDWGTEPTEKVAAAIPDASNYIHELVRDWQHRSSKETAV